MSLLLRTEVELLKKDISNLAQTINDNKEESKAERSQLKHDTEKILFLIEGDGNNGHMSLKARLTAVEKKVWVLWGISGSAVASVLGIIGHYIVKHL